MIFIEPFAGAVVYYLFLFVVFSSWPDSIFGPVYDPAAVWTLHDQANIGETVFILHLHYGFSLAEIADCRLASLLQTCAENCGIDSNDNKTGYGKLFKPEKIAKGKKQYNYSPDKPYPVETQNIHENEWGYKISETGAAVALLLEHAPV
jgi:hypothetical protein